MDSKIFKNVFIKDFFSLVGPLEKEGRLKHFDFGLDDYYFGEKTFELAEVKMQKTVIENLLKRNILVDNNIDILIGGDLLNQISATSYSARNFDIPYLGVYSACATFVESLFLGATLIDAKTCNNALLVVSSHNLTAEKQFRFPIEYGSPKPHTSTFTATGAVSTLLTNEKTKYKLESATIGTVFELGYKDANHMGAVMAPAAAKTLYKHLTDLKRDANYYDIILTGDLGCVGANILRNYMKKVYNIKLDNYMDAGCDIFLKSQDTYAGGSGPVCLPLVLYNKILKNNKYKKILIIGTGSLHSVVFVNQKLAIPAIAHAVSLEVL